MVIKSLAFHSSAYGIYNVTAVLIYLTSPQMNVQLGYELISKAGCIANEVGPLIDWVIYVALDLLCAYTCKSNLRTL